MEGTFPPVTTGFVPGTHASSSSTRPASNASFSTPAQGSGGPNPALAGVLAGFFPFGVGAVYTGQYAKGLAHLAIFVLLIMGANAADHDQSTALGVFSGLGIAFFYVYQIIDAVRTAKAIQTAQPVPDPFGLAATFSGGEKIEASKIPLSAIVLILLGVLFLLHTMGLAEYGLDRYWPLILIFVGSWMFVRNWGSLDTHDPNCQCSRCRTRRMAGPLAAFTACQCARCRTRRITGPVMLVTVGLLFLLENVSGGNLGFHRTWPIILLVVGGIKLLQASSSAEGHVGRGTIPPPSSTTVPPSSGPIVPPVTPSGEVNHG